MVSSIGLALFVLMVSVVLLALAGHSFGGITDHHWQDSEKGEGKWQC